AVRATDDPDYEEEHDPDEDVPFHLPKASADEDVQPTMNPRHNPSAMPTMPQFREPGTDDPKVTLVGTGGLDPNPDMNPQPPRVDSSYSANTVMNIPKAPPQAQMT